MIVVDASAVVPSLLRDGPARERMTSVPAHAPHLIDGEVANALRRLVAAGAVPVARATAAVAVLQRLEVKRHAVRPLLGRIWELRDNLSAYDAAYVALAEQLGCELLTADARIAGAPGIRCAVTVVPR